MVPASNQPDEVLVIGNTAAIDPGLTLTDRNNREIRSLDPNVQRCPQHLGYLPKLVERNIVPLVMLDIPNRRSAHRLSHLGGDILSPQATQLAEPLQLTSDPKLGIYLCNPVTVIRIRIAGLP